MVGPSSIVQTLPALSGSPRLSRSGGEAPMLIPHIQWLPIPPRPGAQTQIVTADFGAEGVMHGISKRTGVARAQPGLGRKVLALYESVTQQEEECGLVIYRSELS